MSSVHIVKLIPTINVASSPPECLPFAYIVTSPSMLSPVFRWRLLRNIYFGIVRSLRSSSPRITGDPGDISNIRAFAEAFRKHAGSCLRPDCMMITWKTFCWRHRISPNMLCFRNTRKVLVGGAKQHPQAFGTVIYGRLLSWKGSDGLPYAPTSTNGTLPQTMTTIVHR